MKRVWPNNSPIVKHSGYFKLSYNPIGLLFKEISKKNKKVS